jgi:hypothetical protein
MESLALEDAMRALGIGEDVVSATRVAVLDRFTDSVDEAELPTILFAAGASAQVIPAAVEAIVKV